jgi:hypothetical protein
MEGTSFCRIIPACFAAGPRRSPVPRSALEEPEEQDKLTRERAFVKEYGVKYTYLIAGAPSEMWEKVPQAVNLNTWPATIFVGRDGLVKGIHSGFASQASGEFNTQLQEEFTAKIEQLLAQKAGENLATATAQVKPGQ